MEVGGGSGSQMPEQSYRELDPWGSKGCPAGAETSRGSWRCTGSRGGGGETFPLLCRLTMRSNLEPAFPVGQASWELWIPPEQKDE